MPKLGEILEQVSRSEPVDLMKEYHLLGIRLEGGGAFHRETKIGSQVSANIFFKVKSGDFIYSRLFAWRGAFDVIDNSLDSFYVSNEFPTFIHKQDKIDAEFLRLWFRLPGTIAKVEALCSGSTPLTRNRLKEDKFLNLEIPLPTIEEQRRIVARIEEMATKIEEARGLQKQIQNDLYVLRRSIFFDSTKGKLISTPMRDLLILREADVFVNPEETYHFAGIYSFGKGMFKGQHRTGTEFSYTRLTHLRTNNFVYPKLMAWEGALAIVPSECEGLVVSPEFPVFEVNQDKVLPETLEIYFQSPDVWPLLSGASTGTNVRRKRLNPSDFFAFEMPLPSMETQILLRDVNRSANIIKRYYTEATIELNALLPSILDKAFKGEL